MQTIDQMGRRGILCPTMGQRVLVAGTEALGYDGCYDSGICPSD